MPDFAAALGASKAASSLLVLFVPSKDRRNKPIDQRYWVKEMLNTLGTLFGGATAFPRGEGIWRDDAQGGKPSQISRLSSNATQPSVRLSRRCPCCGTFFTAWDVMRDKAPSD